jgi:hypothetical protein
MRSSTAALNLSAMSHARPYPIHGPLPALAQPPHHVPVADQLATVLTSAKAETSTDAVGLPLTPLFSPLPPPSLYCVITPVDNRGRLADRSPIRAMKWQPRQPLTIFAAPGIAVIVAQPNGVKCITVRGHLRLAAHIRHLCRIAPGDRVLVAAAPRNNLIVIYTMPMVESILLRHHTAADAPHKATP